MDVTSIVNELMKRQNLRLNRLKYDEQEQEVKLSLYAQMKSIFDNVNHSIASLDDAFSSIAFTSSVSNNSILSASIISNDNLFSGDHEISVTSIAKSETLGSNAEYGARDQSLNLAGNLTISVNGNSYDVTVAATDTLDNIRDKINQSSNNVGVTASIVASTDQNGQPSYSLVMSSDKTGSENTITLGGSIAGTLDFTNVISSAQDAIFTFDGKNVVRSENTINDVLDSVTFTLLDVGQSTLSIGKNTSDKNESVVAGVKSIIDAYNMAMDYIDQSLADRSLTDSSVNMMKMSLHALFSENINNNPKINALLDIGIKTAEAVKSQTKSGSAYTAADRLTLDENKLRSILATNPEDFEKFFTDTTTGFIKDATKKINDISQFGGVIANRTLSINENISKIERRIGDEESRLETVRTQLIARYSALNAMMDKFDRLSGMLENIFNNLTFTNKK